jgi:membrane fusion protein, multidrug efflux system
MNLMIINPKRPFTTLMLMVALTSGILGLSKLRFDIFNPPKVAKAAVGPVLNGVRAQPVKGHLVGQFEWPFSKQLEEERHKIVLTSPKAMDVAFTQRYVGQIRAQRHIKVCAVDSGYLEEILVREGQRVKKGDVMFKIVQTFYKAKRDAKSAAATLAQLEYSQSKRLSAGTPGKAVVSATDVAQSEAKLARARAEAEMAQAELNFTKVSAPFDGIVDRLQQQLGSLIKDEDILTFLSDNSVMWVYFNVSETQYLKYMAARKQHEEEDKIELELADETKFPQSGKIGAIQGDFDDETGNIAFRADFPNPDGLLRHGQTGTVLIHQKLQNAIVIPMRATYEILDKQYVYVVDKNDVVHQRQISIQSEDEDIFVIKKGVDASDRIVLDGTRQVRDGDKVEYEFRTPEEVLGTLKFHAE